jgi:hypothetical protein
VVNLIFFYTWITSESLILTEIVTMFVGSLRGMYVTKEDIILDRREAENDARRKKDAPSTTASGEIDYPDLRKRFRRAFNQFSYRYNGDPLRSMFSNDPEPYDEIDDLPEIQSCEAIEDTPVNDCIVELVKSFNESSPDSVLRTSFATLVDFAWEISNRIDRFVENVLGEDDDDGYHSRFFRGIYDALMDAARLLRSKGIKPKRHSVRELLNIGPGFEDVVDVFKDRLVPGATKMSSAGSDRPHESNTMEA